MSTPGSDLERLLDRLASRRALARLAILFERAWPVLWPPIGVAGVFVCLALLDVPRLLPLWSHFTLLAVTALAFFGLLLRGLGSIVAPDLLSADRRLELSSGLAHRPLAVLTDRPARTGRGIDAAGLALWQAHLARTIRQIRRLRVGLPRPGLAKRDPRALRVGLLVALVATFGIAGEDAPSRLADAVQPTLPRATPPPGTELEAWITPPAYTHLAPIFLRHAADGDAGLVTVPAGSRLTVSVTGGSGVPSLSLEGETDAFRALDQGSFQIDRALSRGGHLVVRRDGRALAAWELSVVADQPPMAAWSEPPGRVPGSQQLRLPWRTSDDYGVVSLQAEMRLKDRPDAPPLIVSVPLPGGSPKTAHGVSQQDLTAHPWAGLPVIARLVARDALGQAGESGDADFELPERPFVNPMARALIAIRRGLSVHPGDRDTAVNNIDHLLTEPDAFKDDYGAYVSLGAIYYQLELDKSAEAIDQVQRMLWELALHFEEGGTERTARALEQARQAARDALNKAMREPNDANRTELERKLKELEQAIEQHMQALMEEARRNGEAIPYDPNAEHMSNRDLERMAEEARQAAREGRMEDAQQRLAELEQMLDRLRNARGDRSRQGEHPEGQRQRGRQQMGAVQDMIGRQGGLLDHAQKRAEGERPQGNQPASKPGDEASEREADQRVQQALRRALGELMQQFGDLTGQVPPSLGEADTAMRDAGRQLGQGQDKAAGESEQRAIEALQKGGREMGQAMAKAFGQGQQGGDQEGDEGSMGFSLQEGQGDWPGNGHGYRRGGPPDRANPGGRDPLGRRYGQGSSGADESADVTVPEERERQRTQAIQEELRRRGAERERPQQELDYIDRLLKQF